jgi:YHS domain-containing protein
MTEVINMLTMTYTIDPITGKNIQEPAGHPCVHDKGESQDLTVYFESEETKRQFLEIPIEHPESDFHFTLDNPSDEIID